MRLQDIQRKARFGHRDWVVWRARDGQDYYGRKSPATVKAAMLASGTQGRFTLVTANDGWPIWATWRIGLNLLAWMKHGIY